MAWLHTRFLCLLTVCLLVVYMLTYLGEPQFRPIDSDGAGYYAYLPSLLLYADPSFETDARVHYGGEFPAWTYVRRYPPTGRYLNSYWIGVALLMVPFFLAAHALTWWFGWPWDDSGLLSFQFAPDGYSFFYQHAAGLAGLTYAVLSLALLKRTLDRHFSKGVVVATLSAMVLGTNFLFYATRGSVCAHPYTLFLSAAMIALTEAWYQARPSVRITVLLGVVLALLVLVRPINILLALWVPLYGLVRGADVPSRLLFWWTRRASLALMVLVGFLVMTPQFLLWKYATGHFWVRSYQHINASVFGPPQVGALFFGWKRGIFVWFPVFVLVAWGLFYLRGPWAGYRVPVLTVIVAVLLVVSINQYWTTACGFGSRYAVDLVPFAAFPLAALYGTRRRPWAQVGVVVLSVLAVAHTLFLLTVVYRQELGMDSMEGIKSFDRLFDVYWWRWKLLFGP